MSEDITAITALLEQASRLGLIPRYRWGTVQANSGSNPAILKVTLDGDTQSSRVYNLIGFCPAGLRVFTVSVKPHGVYAFGAARTSLTPVKEIVTDSGSGTFRPDDALMYATIECIGGGGGGGGVALTAAGQAAAAGGGSGGSYCMKIFTAAELAGGIAYSVGVGGPGGVGNAAGTAGGNTTISTLVATGGGAGNGMAAGAGTSISNGGTPVAATGGTLNVIGGFGNNGLIVAGAVVQQGFGGSGALFGGIARGGASVNGANGVSGLQYGGGGSGGHNFASQGTAKNGGAGSNGAIIFTTYYQ